uniref:DUF8207 domain-containing protein n=1 Tax=Cacopsylla melanoneura TaxID=428564 RepID=A0A8D8PUM4_9HEMI
MSLSKELNQAKAVARKIQESQREIRDKTLQLKLGESERQKNISQILKPLTEPLEKMVQLKDKKSKGMERVRERYLKTKVKEERPPIRRLYPLNIRKTDSPASSSLYTPSPPATFGITSPFWELNQTDNETDYKSPYSEGYIPSSPRSYKSEPSQLVYTSQFNSPQRKPITSRLASSRPTTPGKQIYKPSLPSTPSNATNPFFNQTRAENEREEFVSNLSQTPTEQIYRLTNVASSSKQTPVKNENELIDFDDEEEKLEDQNPSILDLSLPKQSLIDTYTGLLQRRSEKIDKVTGVKFKDGKFTLGKKEIEFVRTPSEAFKIDSKIYPATEGLLQLLFFKQPKQEELTALDVRNYKNIIKKTELEPSTIKVQQYEGTGLMLDNDRDINYIYFDDPNELVDRLHLLKSSQAAGNKLAHNNEIISIEEELREGQYIY